MNIDLSIIIKYYEYVIIAVLTFVIVLIIVNKIKPKKKIIHPSISQKDDLQWINKGHNSPTEVLKDLILEFGEPDSIDKTIGGSAIWKKSTLSKKGSCLERIEIIDELIPHNFPIPHSDFLYTWYKINIPKDKINQIKELNDEIEYDPLKQLVRVRCNFIHANVATLILIKRIVSGKLNIDTAKKAYEPMILAGKKDNKLYKEGLYKEIVKELCSSK